MLALRAGRLVPAVAQARSMSGLPYRIRAPLAKLVDSKKDAGSEAAAAPAGGLGDGEKLETNETGPDYVGLALRSRVYDMVHETPLQFASGLSAKLNAMVHLKREDLLPSFSFKLRGAYNLLATRASEDGLTDVITYSVGSQGHSLAIAANALGHKATVVMPERTPLKRRQAIERTGAQVVVAGQTLSEAQEHAEAFAASHTNVRLVEPHNDPLVIAGQATAGLEVIKQIGPALEGRGKLDAIFVVAGGSSLLAGIAAVFKSIMPHTKVIGVEAEAADVLHRSLLAGHRIADPEPAHFVDGASVRQLGAETFRVCNDLVDDIVVVSDDEICAAVRDAFEDTRAVLEPAGALAIAGLKKYVDAMPAAPAGGSKGNYCAISSDASNIEFDILRFIAERAAIGEQREKLFALRMPDRMGMFRDMYRAVQPRLVTEFVYRHAPHHPDALVYMSIEASEAELAAGHTTFSQDVCASLDKLGVYAVDITGDELGKTHAKHLAGGRAGELEFPERIIRFEFPENAGALMRFLEGLRKDWFLTMLHYRNHGGQVGKVLAGVRVPKGEEGSFTQMCEGLGYKYTDESENLIYTDFMR
jgi:threonine dehydratase